MPIQPLLLQFRTDDAGGEMRPDPNMDEFYKHWSKGRLVLLIHGFNTTLHEARDAYDNGFFRLQRQLANHAPGDNFAPDRDFVEVFWKGDDWGVASPIYYIHAVPNAVQTASALAEVLRKLAAQRAEGLDLQIVAHSLGTRLMLELVRNIGADRNIRISRLVFFAAATATFMLNDPDDAHGLRKAYDAVVKEGALNLYSGNDSVLSLAFPVGQTLTSGHEGFFPTALGHELWESPNVPETLNQNENRNAGHGDYWGSKQDKPDCEMFANSRTRDYLGFTGLGDRSIAGADTPERETPEADAAATREIGARTTPGRVT